MKKGNHQAHGPRGGLSAGRGPIRGWHWSQAGTLVSAPVRCKREQWYLARGRVANAARLGRVKLMMRFRHRDETASERTLALHRVTGDELNGDLLGWVQAPDDATHLQLHLLDPDQANLFAEVVFHAVAERDPKCHPLANVPPWNSYRPPFPIERTVLPPSLECLAPLPSGRDVQLLQPRSLAQLAKATRRAACVLDPTWEARFGLQWADLERLASEAWLIVDLETTWKLARRAGLKKAQLVTHEAAHGIMSARVEYADVATRGFALQDVFPYATVNETGGFGVRVFQADHTWKRYADAEGFATLLASETPDPKHCGDVLSAARPVGRGELITTDLPWLVSGQFGPLLAPRLARHALEMHLAEPVDDDVQYWNRWDDAQIVVRDISDLCRRYQPLRAVRWVSADDALVHLGVALPSRLGVPSERVLVIRTGRIDNMTAHDGLPPEPMIILMKMLARQARERSTWAERYLRDLTVIWQFDTAAGLRYASNYASAATVVRGTPRIVRLGPVGRRETPQRPQAEIAAESVETFAADEGIFGDGALDCQARLNARVQALIERESGV